MGQDGSFLQLLEQGVVPGMEPEIAPGVRGFMFDTPNGLYIPMVAADKPGSGHVSAFLNTLSTDKRVVFPAVVSGKLLGMLLRRGFTPKDEFTDDGEQVEVMERLPAGVEGGRHE